MSAAEQSKKGSGRERKEPTSTQRKVKIAFGWIINIVCIAIIIFSLAVAIITITGSKNDGLPNLFGTTFMAVKSDSMSGTFEKDDLILGKVYAGDGSDLKVGQVITYKDVDDNKNVFLNTHRIVEKTPFGFKVVGDNPKYAGQTQTVPLKNIKATWGSVGSNGQHIDGDVWKNMGALTNWLSDPKDGKVRFFCAIVLPLILLFAAYAFVLIRSLVINKIQAAKDAAEAATATVTADSLSDEDKRRLAEEYLKTMSENKSIGGDSGDGGVNTEEVLPDGDETVFDETSVIDSDDKTDK